jgi:HPt (histidine-containing phosphotransfer) domain-containing protein
MAPDRLRPEAQRAVTVNTEPADFDRAEMLEQVGGDRQLVKELVELFLGTSPGHLERVRQAVAAGDAMAVRQAAHALKGAAGCVGAKKVWQVALDLETMGRTADLSRAADSFTALEPALERLRLELVRLLEEGEPG